MLSPTPSAKRTRKVVTHRHLLELPSLKPIADGKGKEEKKEEKKEVPKVNKAIKKGELGGTHRSTPQPKAAHLAFRDFQKAREDEKAAKK